MGQEFAQAREWSHERSLDWHLLDDPRGRHAGLQRLLRDLNRLYRETPALHQLDCEGQGFQWIEANAAEESVFAWARFGEGDAAPVVVVCNFTPVERSAYRLGVPAAGRWIERVNSDAADYGGGGRGNLGGVESRPVAAQGRSDSIEITLPPLSTVVFELG
jgi:1,4-alpha-glucan branching enzyme